MAIPAVSLVMYEQFRKLGTKVAGVSKETNKAADEAFHSFKKGGGRFFKVSRISSKCHELDNKAARERIKALIYARMRSSQHWLSSETTGTAVQGCSILQKKTRKETPNSLADAIEESNDPAANERSSCKPTESNVNGRPIARASMEDSSYNEDRRAPGKRKGNEKSTQIRNRKKATKKTVDLIDENQSSTGTEGYVIPRKRNKQTDQKAHVKKTGIEPPFGQPSTTDISSCKSRHKELRTLNQPKCLNTEEAMPIGQQNVTFHCPNCSNDFVYSSAESASSLFADHVKQCKPFNPHELRTGDRVIVMGKDGKGWQATIQKCHTQKGEPGFMIHYDGKKKTNFDWVPFASVVNYIADDG